MPICLYVTLYCIQTSVRFLYTRMPLEDPLPAYVSAVFVCSSCRGVSVHMYRVKIKTDEHTYMIMGYIKRLR